MWTKTAHGIITKVRRGRAALDNGTKSATASLGGSKRAEVRGLLRDGQQILVRIPEMRWAGCVAITALPTAHVLQDPSWIRCRRLDEPQANFERQAHEVVHARPETLTDRRTDGIGGDSERDRII